MERSYIYNPVVFNGVTQEHDYNCNYHHPHSRDSNNYYSFLQRLRCFIFNKLFGNIRSHHKLIISQLNLNIILRAGDQALRLFKDNNQLILKDVRRYFQRIVESQIDSHGIIMVTVNYPFQSKFWRIKSNFQISFVLWLHLNLSICLIDPGDVQICVHLLVKFNCYLSMLIHLCWISAAVICCLIVFLYKVCIFIAFYFLILLN